MNARERVQEFLRQWKIGRYRGDIIYSCGFDSEAEAAPLTVSDLEELLSQTPETRDGISAIQLREIALQVKSWIDWSKDRRDEENLITDDDTHIMTLPVPYWPTHGQFDNWVNALREAADQLDVLK